MVKAFLHKLLKQIVNWNTKDRTTCLDFKSGKFLVKAFYSFFYARGSHSQLELFGTHGFRK